MSLAHPLRPSVMRADEWFKDRDQAAWVQIKKQALHRDQYTCSYCLLICQKFGLCVKRRIQQDYPYALKPGIKPFSGKIMRW